MNGQIQWRYFISNFLFVFIPLGVLFGSLLFYVYSSEIMKNKHILGIREINQVKAQLEIVKGEYQNISSDLMVVSDLHELHNVLDGDAVDVQDLARELKSISTMKKMYDQIRYLDDTGSEVVRINFNDGNPYVVPSEQLQNKGKRYYFTDTFELKKNEIFISPLDLNIEQGQIEQPIKPMIRFGTPVFSKDGERKGIVLLNYFGALLINKLQSFPTDDNHALFSFLNPQGYWLKGPEPDAEWGFMSPDKKNKTFGNKFPGAWSRISTTDSGQFLDEDGLFTYTTFYPLAKFQISSTGSSQAFAPSKNKIKGKEYYFKIVSHVPASVLEEDADRIFQKLLKIYLLILFISFAGAWTFAYFRENRRKFDLEREKMIADIQRALSEIKTLKGIVPICAYCKEIRDDEGFWSKVEEYVEKYTEAEFSHGICPKCAKKHFPEFYSEEHDHD